VSAHGATRGGVFAEDFGHCHRQLWHIWLGASSVRVLFPNLSGILSVCGAVDAGLTPQASSTVEAFSCGGVLPLRSRIPHQLLGARRLCPMVSDFGCSVIFPSLIVGLCSCIHLGPCD
jgi:hypothetical protein